MIHLMVSTLVAATAMIASYQIGPSDTLDYRLKVEFAGFLPVLGGNEGTVRVEMDVEVEGQEPEEAPLVVASEIEDADIFFNDERLPLGIEEFQRYFPRTTIQAETTGRILETDAPEIELPIRLPGLDVKRFPDITYLPLVFPEQDLEAGDIWEFERQFGEENLAYRCEVLTAEDDVLFVQVEIEQEYTALENSALEIVEEEQNAVAEATTTLNGYGYVNFNVAAGQVLDVAIVNEAVTKVRDLDTDEVEERNLTTTLKFYSSDREEPETPEPPVGTTTFRAPEQKPGNVFDRLLAQMRQAIPRAQARLLAMAIQFEQKHDLKPGTVLEVLRTGQRILQSFKLGTN